MITTKLPRPPEHLQHEIAADQVRVSVHGHFIRVLAKSASHPTKWWITEEGIGSSLTEKLFVENESWLVGYTGNVARTIIYDHLETCMSIVAAGYTDQEFAAGPIDFTIEMIHRLHDEPGWVVPGRNGGPPALVAAPIASALIPTDYYPTEPEDRPAPSPLWTCVSCKGTGGDERGTCWRCRGFGSVPRPV